MKIEAGHDYVARDGERWTNARRNPEGQWELTDAKGRSFWFEDDGQFGDEGEDCRHNLTPTTGPVRTVTTKEIVSGYYGHVKVAPYDDTRVFVHISSTLSADELRDAIATLTEIADALGEAS